MIVSAGILCVLAVVMCFIPLFNLLGYESAAATGAVLGFIAAIRTARHIDRGDVAPPLDSARRVGPTADFRRLLAQHLALIPLPMLLLALNALRVQNCDLALGARFWLVIPTGAALVGQSIAWGAAALPRFRLPAALAVVFAEVGLFAWRFAWQPPITGHQWFIGYFSGSIYDEALSLPSSLLWFRAANVLLSVAIVLGVEVAWRRRTRRPLLSHASGLLVALVLLLGIRANSFELGITVSRDDAIETLGGHLQTEHFDIYYDPGSIPADRLHLVAEDHEFNYAQHVAWLDVDVVQWRGERIRSFIYPNRNVQKQLLGSRNTMVARPWTHELHIRWSSYAEGALPHEMAHIFSAAFGGGPLQLATSGGLIPNIGMLEGLAEGADWPNDELDPHIASAALRRLDKAPDLRVLFNPAGFWSQPSRRAYTLMGSFVRYLVDTYGIDKLKAAYGRGDFVAAYGRSTEDLITEWEGFIDEYPVSEHEQALASYLYRRGSIFERVCARTIGELSRKASAAAGQGKTARARALWEEIAALEPGNPSHQLVLARVQADDGDSDAAAETVAVLLGQDLSPARRAAALELQGDLRWQAGATAEASDAYDEAMSVTLPESSRRRLVVKRHGVTAPSHIEAVAERYMLGDLDRAEAVYAAQRWAELAPSDPMPAYLVGRLLYAMEDFPEAVRWLSRATDLPDQALREERALQLARARYLTGDLTGARHGFSSLLRASSSRVRVSAQDGLDRIAWKQAQP